MPKTPLLVVIVQFWDHLITDTFVTFLLKSGFRFEQGPSEMFFKDILFWGLFPIVIPIVDLIANLDHEGVELSCWNCLWLISALKDTIKTRSRHVWMFLTKSDTPWCHLSHVTCHVSHVRCQRSSVFFVFGFSLKIFLALVGRGSVINWAYPV